MAANMTAVFSARDRMSNRLEQMSNSGNRLTRALGTIGKVGGAAFAAVGVAAGVAAKKGIDEFAEFQGKMNEVFTLMPDISQDGMDKMSEQVKEFSKKMGVLPNEVVPALYQSISASVPPDNVFSFLETAQKSAIGGVTKIETAVDGLTTVINAYGAKNMSVQQASDLMFTTVRLGKTNFEQLSTSMGQVLPSATAAGVKFQDVSAALATMTAKGIGTAESSTKVRAAIDELAKPGTKISGIFKKIAKKDFRQFIKEGGNLSDALQLVAKEAGKTGKQVGDMFGSVEASQAATFLTNDDTFVKNLKEMQKSAGATDKAYEKMDRGIKRTWDRIKANTSVALIEIGDMLAPYIEKLANWFLKALPYIQKFLKFVLTKTAQIFDKLSAQISKFVNKAKPLFKPLVETAKTIGKDITKGIGYALKDPSDLENAFQALKEDIVNGIYDSLPKDAADKVSSWFLDVWGGTFSVFQTVHDFFSQSIPKIIDIFKPLVGGIADVLSNVGEKLMEWGATFGRVMENDIMPFVNKVVSSFNENILPIIKDVVDFIQTKILPVINDAVNFVTTNILPLLEQTFNDVFPRLGHIVSEAFVFIKAAWDDVLYPVLMRIMDIFNLVWPFIKQIVEVAVRGIKDVITGLVQTFDGIITFITGVFTGNWSKAWTGIKDIFGGIFHSLIGLAKVPLNTIIGLINGAIENINKIKMPSWVPGIGGKGVSIPKIPMLAKGTNYWNGGKAIVGEAGAELVVGPRFGELPTGSKVFPNDKTQNILKQIVAPRIETQSVDFSSLERTSNSLLSLNKMRDSLLHDSINSMKTSDIPLGDIRSIAQNTSKEKESKIEQNDNRQYTINIDSKTVAKTEDKKEFMNKVKQALDSILSEERDTGGEMSIEF